MRKENIRSNATNNWVIFRTHTSGTIEKLIPVKQCLSAGNRIPYFSGISGNGTLFFSWASSNKN